MSDWDYLSGWEDIPFEERLDRIDGQHFGFDGEPISLRTWMELLRDERKIVAQERIGGYFISTVWLGLDHNFMGSEIHIFETMVFNEEGEGIETLRYPTKERAIEGHLELRNELALIEAALTTEDDQ